ncbi:MAG: hypothetical protein HAW63_02160 [Bdellovibrionaceae bacterium]|nr:hypothetical protein [Pseudobdellovibrionaceae bacterium]
MFALPSTIIYFISFIVALCSLSYELILSQLLAVSFGGTLFYYSVTMGIFMFSLGLGSLYYTYKKSKNLISLLVKTEIILTALGLLSPYWILYTSSFQNKIYPMLFYFLIHLPSILIGFFSGLELPNLLDLSSKKNLCLYYDYLGMFVSSVLFYVLIKQLNLINITLLITSLNLFVALLLLSFNKKYFHLEKIISIILLLVLIFHWIYSTKIATLWQYLILLT